MLFIDEACYLYRDSDARDYGQEAVVILLQVMENQRDRPGHSGASTSATRPGMHGRGPSGCRRDEKPRPGTPEPLAQSGAPSVR